MDKFINTTVIWFIVGFIFFLLEFVVPGVILLFFGIGAWVVGLILIFYTSISLTAQILIFLGTSVFTAVLFRNWVRAKLGMIESQNIVLEDEIIGKKARAETAITPGLRGKVFFRGVTWEAVSPQHINEGEEVIITAHESIILTVKPTKLA